jgi:hypothetical protein
VTSAAQDRAPDSSTNAKCRTAKLLPYCPLLKPNAHLMNLTSRAGGVMQKKPAFIGVLLLSLALVPRTAMAELNDGSLSSTGKARQFIRRRTRIRISASLLHSVLRTFRFSRRSPLPNDCMWGQGPSAYRSMHWTIPLIGKDKKIWENVIDVRTGRTAGPETVRSLNELELEERDNINALGSVKQELSDAVAIAEKAAAGKAISGGLVKEVDQLNFVVVVLSYDHVKEVFLEPPRATSKGGSATSRG